MTINHLFTEHFLQNTVWVTGAGRGIGLSVAKAFSAAGASVIGFDLCFDNDAEKFLAKKITLDISNSKQTDACLQELLKTGCIPDVFVSVAGILRLGLVDELSREDWLDSFNINVFACFYFLQALLPYFKEKKSGSIVAVCSNASKVPRYKMAAYSASKAALSSLLMSTGLELAEYGVRVNTVSPGSTLTSMQTDMWKQGTNEQDVINGSMAQYRLPIPLQKMAKPEEIANTVLFLSSSLASHITLQDIVVDGGATLGV